MKKNIRISYPKERLILSDTNPYETPTTYSNKKFFDFLIQNHIEVQDNKIFWRRNSKTLDQFIRLILGIPAIDFTPEISNNRKTTPGDIKSKDIFWSIPFHYKIAHKENEPRNLSIPHPRNQIALIDFFHKNKELIIYHSQKSPFSIRRPIRVAKSIFYNDELHQKKIDKTSEWIESDGKEYEYMRSFFVYEKYSNIYQFYESYQFHRLEKKFNYLVKADISKCFESVYTHSLAWALYGKDTVKSYLGRSRKTFADAFDKIMQSLNYNETNGIIIGPEISRIFSELILQSIDVQLAGKLSNSYKLFNKKNYDICRYVDDYFIFYNHTDEKDVVIRELQAILNEYRFHINSSKTVEYSKPIITGISISKSQISHLLEENIYCYINEKTPNVKYTIKAPSPSSLITKYKIILKSSETNYKDVLNYTLSILRRKVQQIIDLKNTTEAAPPSSNEVLTSLNKILEFVFFIYLGSPKANTSIQLCNILQPIINYTKDIITNKDLKGTLLQQIRDNLVSILKNTTTNEHTQVESLYLLILLRNLGKNYWLDRKTLCEIFQITPTGSSYELRHNLNYFSITVLLFYMSDKTRYEPIRQYIETVLVDKLTKDYKPNNRYTEGILLLLDTLTCPYISTKSKRAILAHHEITDIRQQNKMICFRECWFTKWHDFDLSEELEAKRGYDVY